MTPPAVGVVLDCADPEALAPFWAAALDYVRSGGVDQYVRLLPDGRPGFKLLLQQVAEPKTTKNRLHLDIDAPDIEAEANRLVGLGATRLRERPYIEHGTSWILLADPEGNEFCVCDAG
jgi:predicted enzyme related to lactoylglutathione lyase